MRPSRRSRDITVKMAWMLFWLSALASLFLIVRANDEFRVLAFALMLASTAWLAGCHLWARLLRRGGRRRGGGSARHLRGL